MEDKPKFAFVGNSHMAFWALNVYFPQWECLNYGAPGEGLAYVESFHEDTSDCQVVIQFGSNDIYQLNEENTDDNDKLYLKTHSLNSLYSSPFSFQIWPYRDSLC